MTEQQKDELLINMNQQILVLSNQMVGVYQKIDDTKAELRQEIQDTKTELNQKIEDTKTELRQEIQDTKTELKQEIKETNYRLGMQLGDQIGKNTLEIKDTVEEVLNQRQDIERLKKRIP